MYRHAATLAVFVIAAAAQAGTIDLITDTEMPGANWSAAIQSQGGGFSFNASQSGAGGNPAAYRAIAHASQTGFTFGTVAHLHATAWDPAISGAITSLDMSVDVNCFNGGTSAAVGFGLIVEQGGTIFFGPTFTALHASGWRSDLNFAGLTAASFSNGGNPDFSAAGAPIRFGFFSSNGTGNSTPISSLSGGDNFMVSLVPSPAAIVFLAPLVTARRRRV